MPCLLDAEIHHDMGSHDRPSLLPSCLYGTNAFLQGKAGMEYLVRVAARLYAKKGINCNAIIPGLVLAGESHAKSALESTLPPSKATGAHMRLSLTMANGPPSERAHHDKAARSTMCLGGVDSP